MEPTQLLSYAQRLQAIAQAGIAYSTTPYDLERYEEIRLLSVKLLQELTEEPLEKIVRIFASETGYQTPKVDVRAVLFRGGNEVLLVQEKIDQSRWTLPGGWADVGYTPYEVAEGGTRRNRLAGQARASVSFTRQEKALPPSAALVRV
jgi:hypothetical protein